MSIEVQIDDRIRLISSVMLLTDFVHENEASGRPHPLKTRTIQHLSKCANHPCAEAARKLAAENWMHRFHSYAILLPEGAWRDLVASGVHPEEHPVVGEPFNDFDEADFGSLLYQFYIDSKIQALWDDTEADWEAARKDCSDIVKTSQLDGFLDLLFGKSDYRMSLIPNPIDPPTFGFAPSDGRTAYAIVGPPCIADESDISGRYTSNKEMVIDLAFHEFSHALWSSACKGYPSIVEETAMLQDTMEYRGYFPRMYDTWESILDEIVIRAATAQYTAHRDGQLKARAFLDREKSLYGIDLIDKVFISLDRYLGARKHGNYSSLSEFLPELSDMIRASTGVA